MHHEKTTLAVTCLAIAVAGCAAQPQAQRSSATMKLTPHVPSASTWTTAPLRHRLRVELNAAVAEVWSLVGQHARLPEYSSGIASVELEETAGQPRAYVCHFRSPEGSGPGPSLRSLLRWEEANVGYAAAAEPGNAFGLANALELVTVSPSPAGALVTWEEYYDSPDLPGSRASIDAGLADYAERLVARFGGKVVERSVDVPR